MDIKIKKGWDDITVAQYMALEQMEKEEYAELIDKGIVMVDIIYGIDSKNISYTDFRTLLNTLDWMKNKPKKIKAKASYIINDTKYLLDMDYANFTTSQFIDLTNYRKDGDYIGMLSVVLIPEGHAYMDGAYNINKVKEDMAELTVTDAMSILGFFLTASTRFIQFIITYLQKKTKRMKGVPMEQKEQITSQMKELATIMELSLMS